MIPEVVGPYIGLSGTRYHGCTIPVGILLVTCKFNVFPGDGRRKEE